MALFPPFLLFLCLFLFEYNYFSTDPVSFFLAFSSFAQCYEQQTCRSADKREKGGGGRERGREEGVDGGWGERLVTSTRHLFSLYGSRLWKLSHILFPPVLPLSTVQISSNFPSDKELEEHIISKLCLRLRRGLGGG